MIFAARQVQEKCREQNLDLYMVFVDLTKAFDTISRDGLWQILRKIGCPDLFVDIIQSFHEGMVARVQDQGQTSEPFSVTNGAKQGCVMAPVLFTLVFSAMLNDAFHDNDLGSLIRFRTDGNVFNLRRLNSKTRTSKVLIRDLLFADDCALLVTTHGRRHSSYYQRFRQIRTPFRTDDQSEENRVDLSAKARSRLHSSNHHNRQQPTEGHGQVHILGQHDITERID